MSSFDATSDTVITDLLVSDLSASQKVEILTEVFTSSTKHIDETVTRTETTHETRNTVHYFGKFSDVSSEQASSTVDRDDAIFLAVLHTIYQKLVTRNSDEDEYLDQDTINGFTQTITGDYNSGTVQIKNHRNNNILNVSNNSTSYDEVTNTVTGVTNDNATTFVVHDGDHYRHRHHSHDSSSSDDLSPISRNHKVVNPVVNHVEDVTNTSSTVTTNPGNFSLIISNGTNSDSTSSISRTAGVWAASIMDILVDNNATYSGALGNFLNTVFSLDDHHTLNITYDGKPMTVDYHHGFKKLDITYDGVSRVFEERTNGTNMTIGTDQYIVPKPLLLYALVHVLYPTRAALLNNFLSV